MAKIVLVDMQSKLSEVAKIIHEIFPDVRFGNSIGDIFTKSGIDPNIRDQYTICEPAAFDDRPRNWIGKPIGVLPQSKVILAIKINYELVKNAVKFKVAIICYGSRFFELTNALSNRLNKAGYDVAILIDPRTPTVTVYDF